jgi:hypothetical protein
VKGKIMSLGIRKIIVISLIGLIFLAGNILLVANWLNEKGVPEKANWLRENFLTGTAITVIIALLILLVNPIRGRLGASHRCPVCDKRLLGNSNYCGDCGSKVA